MTGKATPQEAGTVPVDLLPQPQAIRELLYHVFQ
jgi:hypothetical protein